MRKKSIQFFAIALFLIINLTISFGQISVPKNVREYFEILPTDYFSVVCCGENKAEYIKKYVSVEDSKNGFMKGSDTQEDPKYQGFVLKVFSSAGKTFLGLYSHSINWKDYYFLEYKNKTLVNVSTTIPKYSQDNIYEFPRVGSTIKVYQKKFSSPTKEINVDSTVERGAYLYSLIWKNGKFSVTK